MARGSRRFWIAATFAVLVRPQLWWTGLRQLLRFSPQRWWKQRPPVPQPDARVLEFRMATAYGSDGTPDVGEFLSYLEWCRRRR